MKLPPIKAHFRHFNLIKTEKKFYQLFSPSRNLKEKSANENKIHQSDKFNY